MYEELEEIQIEIPDKHVGPRFHMETISLAELYRQGWWITETFGTDATLVRKGQYSKCKKPHFCCIHRFLNPDQITPKADRLIKKIAKERWKIYGPMLTSDKKQVRIKNK